MGVGWFSLGREDDLKGEFYREKGLPFWMKERFLQREKLLLEGIKKKSFESVRRAV